MTMAMQPAPIAIDVSPRVGTRLTAQQVIALKYQLVTYYARMHGEMREALNFYNADYHVLNDKARQSGKFHEVIPVTPRLIVEGVTAHVTPQKFVVKYEPLRDNEKSKEQADRLEHAAHTVLERYSTTKGWSPFTEVCRNCCIYGMAALRTLFDPRAWFSKPLAADYFSRDEYDYALSLWEAQRTTRLPFNLAAVDPLNLLPAPGVEKPDFMMETYRVKPFYLQRDFPEWQDPQPFAEKDFTCFWTRNQWDYLVGGQAMTVESWVDPDRPMQQTTAMFDNRMLEPKQLRQNNVNPYGIIPYSLIWSGLGKGSPYGFPEQRAIGLIYPLRSLLKEEARALTAVSIILQVTALPRFLTRNAPRGRLNLGLGPGDVTEMGNSVIEPFPEMKVPQGIYDMMQVAGQQVERLIGEKILTGVRPSGVTSALFEEILLEQAKRRYKTFINSLENGYAEALGQMFFIWENVIRERIPGINFDPKWIKGYYQPDISFIYEDIAEHRIRTMIAATLFARGLYSFEAAHGYMGTENSAEIRKQLIKDRIYNDPNLITALAMEALQEMGYDKMLQQAQARQSAERRIELPAGGTNVANLKPNPQEADMFQQLLGKGVEQNVLPEGFGGGGFGYGEGREMGEKEALGV